MAVTRRGIKPPTVSRASESLGRVLVTIDDLDALLSLLIRLDRDISARDGKVLTAMLSLEFDGGTFNEGSDLRKMSDEELKRITVKSRYVKVVLAPERAVAFGDPEATERVYRDWARSRQTRVRPEKLTWKSWTNFLTSAQAGAVILFISLISRNHGAIERIIAAIFSVALIVLPLRRLLSLSTDFATVRAVSLDEFRKDRDTGVRHWVMATIALASVVVALASVITTVLLKK